MNKLLDRIHSGMGVIGLGGMLAASIGGALIDRALHPVDTCRDIQKRRLRPGPGPQRDASRPSDAISGA